MIPIVDSGDPDAREADCDGLVIDGLDRNVGFFLDPFCYETRIPAEDCGVALNEDGTCECPNVDDGAGFLLLEGDDMTVRNLSVQGFFEGIRAAGRNATVEDMIFVRHCDDAFGNAPTGVGNLFDRVSVTGGCDKCSQSAGSIADTADDSRVREHYNAIYRDSDFVACQQPLRIAEGGRYLVDGCTMIDAGLTGFECQGPRFTTTEADPLVVHMVGSYVDGCRRGVRFGGHAEGILHDNDISGALLRGVLVAGDAKARLSGNRIVANGGDISSEPGQGGVAVSEGGFVDLGGGAVEIDGTSEPSSGGNAICNNVAFESGLRNVDNLTPNLLFAEGNYWCDTSPGAGVEGVVEVSPFLVEAP
jgi:hypothetical protein